MNQSLSEDEKLAHTIFDWLRRRNGGQLREALGMLPLADYEMLISELTMILEHSGIPPNWVSAQKPLTTDQNEIRELLRNSPCDPDGKM